MRYRHVRNLRRRPDLILAGIPSAPSILLSTILRRPTNHDDMSSARPGTVELESRDVTAEAASAPSCIRYERWRKHIGCIGLNTHKRDLALSVPVRGKHVVFENASYMTKPDRGHTVLISYISPGAVQIGRTAHLSPICHACRSTLSHIGRMHYVTIRIMQTLVLD